MFIRDNFAFLQYSDEDIIAHILYVVRHAWEAKTKEKEKKNEEKRYFYPSEEKNKKASRPWLAYY